MAKDDNGAVDRGEGYEEELEGEDQEDNEVWKVVEGETTQTTQTGSSSQKTCEEKVRLRTLVFSRSAETVGNLGIHQQQTGQRPDRLHARRPSTSRRSGGAVENSTSGSRFTSTKVVYRTAKINSIRTSKSCTKECEVLRADYFNDYSAAYSTLYDHILAADDDESDTSTGVGDDAADSDREDVTLSESTALIIDNGDAEARSDITVTSRESGNSSLGRNHIVGSGERGGESRGERSCDEVGRLKIDSSDECLDSETPERHQHKYQTEARDSYRALGRGGKDDNARIEDVYGGQEVESRCTSPELCGGKVQVRDSTGILFRSHCLTAGNINQLTSQELSPGRGIKQHSVLSGRSSSNTGTQIDSLSRNVSRASVYSTITNEDAEDGQANAVKNFSKSERDEEGNNRDHASSTASSSQVSVQLKRQKPCINKRAPRPEELANAVAVAINSGYFHTSQIVPGNSDENVYLLKANESREMVLLKVPADDAKENDKLREYDLPKVGQEILTQDSPGISILSFTSVKEIADSAMPQRRDHNDVIFGDTVPPACSSGRPGTSLSFTPSETASKPREPAQIGSDGDMPLSPLRGSAHAVNVSDITGPCEKTGESSNMGPIVCAYTCMREYPQKSEECALQRKSMIPMSFQKEDDTLQTGKCTLEPPNEEEYNSQNTRFTPESLNTDHTLQGNTFTMESPKKDNTSQSTRFTSESPQKSILLNSIRQMYYTEKPEDIVTSSEHEIPGPTVAETEGVRGHNPRSDRTIDSSTSKTTTKSLTKSSVPALGSHEYLPFLNKLRQDRTIRKEASRQQRISKSLRKIPEATKKNVNAIEDDCHGDAESLASTPVCPVGREVPADWKPGEHSSHPLTKLSASYTPNRNVKKRRSLRRRRRILNRHSPRRKEKDNLVPLEIARHVSNLEIGSSLIPYHGEASKSCSDLIPGEAGSTDTDANAEDEVLPTFEYKRKYYERLSKMAKDDSGSESKSDPSPLPKRVTSEVKLLKTLDELYSSDSSNEAEAEMGYADQTVYDINHQTSLFNYYTTRLKHMSVLGNIPQQSEAVDDKIPHIRIRRVEQEVPSALDHKRLKSLYECRLKKTILTSKARKVDYFEQARDRYIERSEGVAKSNKQQQNLARGYNRTAGKVHNLPKIPGYKARETTRTNDDSDLSRMKERAVSLEKTKSLYDAFAGNTPHRSYLDILKAGIGPSGHAVRSVSENTNAHSDNCEDSKQKASGSEPTAAKEVARSNIEESQSQKNQPSRDRESINRMRMKVRFADGCNDYKDRAGYEMSDEDTWCSTVNAMLLRANRVMNDVSKNDHRYPKPDSARVVSPVPPKSPTFLKELLKQDTIERKQAKSHIRSERRFKETLIKQDRQDKHVVRVSKPAAPLALFAAGPSFLAIQPTTEASSTQNNSSLVYSVPLKDSAEPTSINEKSAGVLKISIQMSKRGQERAWLTHERIKRQKAVNPEYDIKSEMKALPKKLTPLRISKPINFQNPDSRNLERIPMKDVLSKTLMGLGTSSQQIFQPKSRVAETLTYKEPNFLLDQHSETLHYFRGPYMHQRSSSIVPLFGDSNNNAYLRSGVGEDGNDGDDVHDNKRLTGSGHAKQDVFVTIQGEKTVPTHGSHYGRCFNEEEGERKIHLHKNPVESKDYMYKDYRQRRDTNMITSSEDCLCGQNTPVPLNVFPEERKYTENCDEEANAGADKVFNNDQHRTEDHNTSAPVSNIAALIYLNTLSQAPQNSEEMDEGRIIKSATVYPNSSGLSTDFGASGTPQNVIISRMGISQNTDTYSSTPHLKIGGAIERTQESNKRIETATHDEFNSQDTLLDVLIGYEMETASKVPQKTSEKEEAKLCEVSADGVSAPCSTCYLNQWLPNYLENVHEYDAVSTLTALEIDRAVSEDNMGNDNDDRSVHSSSKVSQDLDSFYAAQFLEEEALPKYASGVPKEILNVRDQLPPTQQPMPWPQLPKPTKKPSICSNFTIRGSTISLTEKRFGNPNLGEIRKKFSRSLKLGVILENGKTSESDLASAENPVMQAPVTRPKPETKSLNKSAVKQSAKHIQENNRAQVFQRSERTSQNMKNSSKEGMLHVDSSENVSDEDTSMNRTYCGQFNWTKIKIPPSFVKGSYMAEHERTVADSEENMAEDGKFATSPEARNDSSDHSIYSTSTVAQCLEREAGQVADGEDSSQCVQTSTLADDLMETGCDSIRDPPNSLCTTTNTKEPTAALDIATMNNPQPLLKDAAEDVSQTSVPDTTGNSENQETQEPRNLSLRSRSSDVEDDRSMYSRSLHAGSVRSQDGLNTISQISYTFDDEDRRSLPSEVDGYHAECEVVDDAQAWKDNLYGDEEAASPRIAKEAEEWHQLRSELKFQHMFFNKNAPPPFEDAQCRDGNRQDQSQTRPELFNRTFLKTLRNTDLVHTVSLDTRRLLRSLQLLTRRQGYLPMFQVRSRQATEMLPLIVTLSHCAKSFLERGSSSFSGMFRSLPVFYTEDNKGFLTSIYTVNWIPEGVYSLEKNNLEVGRHEDLNKSGTDQAGFGKLLQYSPFASDLAFDKDQTFLIGDEVTTREEASRTLVVALDEARGNVAKFFTLMCGWVPPHLNQPLAILEKDTAFEGGSVKSESKEKTCVSAKVLQDGIQYFAGEDLQLPPVTVAVSAYPGNRVVKIVEERAPILPQIVPVTMFSGSDNPQIKPDPHTSNVCHLPAVSKSTGLVTPDAAGASVMLCLRCGVKVANTEVRDFDEVKNNSEVSVPKESARSRKSTKTNARRSPEIDSQKQHRRHSCNHACHHSWEVSEVGLALPLLTNVSIRPPARNRPASDRRTPRSGSESSRKELKMSIRRSTKSQTTFQAKTEPRFALPQVRSQSEINTKSGGYMCTNTPENNILDIPELVQRRGELAGSETMAEFTTTQGTREKVIVGNESKTFEGNEQSENLEASSKTTKPLRLSEINPENRPKPSAAIRKSVSPPQVQKNVKQQISVFQQKPLKQQAPLRQNVFVRQQQIQQGKQIVFQPGTGAQTPNKDKTRDAVPVVAAWTSNSSREFAEDEDDLMEKRAWSHPVIPPPFPKPTLNPAPIKCSHKLTGKGHHLNKSHLAQHRRNLNQISQSYVSPYWAKKEIKRVRSKTPASDSGDDRSSISRITTISGLSSSSSESNTEEESSTEESESDSGSSTSGSDFFTRYANKGGPTSIDDIFKRTLPRQRLGFELTRLKEAKEKEEVKQLGYLRGREGVTPPARDNVKENDHAVTFVLSEYDMCSDAEEIKELWKQCFPEVDFWDRKRRKKFKKTKILS